MPAQDTVAAFTELGLTQVEAEVYVYLVQNSPATGYAIAAAINRTRGATYKVLGSLAEKGAILVDEGQPSQVRAVATAEFLATLEDRFRQRRQAADAAASRLTGSPSDHRIYQLKNTDQIYERARQMLIEGRERVLFEISPGPLEILRAPIEAAAAGGLDITARVYEHTVLPGIRLIISPYGDDLAANWNAQWLAVFVDGRQYLLAQLSREGDRVTQAVWSQSRFLSSAIYSYVNSDLHHYAFRAVLQQAESVADIRAAYARLQDDFPVGGDLGWREQLD